MLTGNFKGFFLFTGIILIHELGHVIGALYYKWNIEKIILLPFGALTIFHEKLNRPLKEEFVILILGPLFQIIGVSIIYLFYPSGDMVSYSNLILAFNLLPIVPLDGSKLMNIILNKLTNFKKSHLWTIYISVLTIIILLLKIELSLIIILIILFILIKLIEEVKNHNNIFNLFLLERCTNKFNFKKRKIIKGKDVEKIKKDYVHLFYTDKYHTEKEILRERFDFTRKM